YLIINAPSLGLAQDALLLAPHVDITLLAINAGEQASRIRDAQNRLQTAAPTPVATMLNRVQEENLETQEGKRLPERGMGELISPK
ncbi:TPA: capsular biosynthesis protein, partial [Klebsiella oxytoca]|nr:capsular biosynthesis protein [Klebsiella oxytoca]